MEKIVCILIIPHVSLPPARMNYLYTILLNYFLPLFYDTYVMMIKSFLSSILDNSYSFHKDYI